MALAHRHALSQDLEFVDRGSKPDVTIVKLQSRAVCVKSAHRGGIVKIRGNFRSTSSKLYPRSGSVGAALASSSQHHSRKEQTNLMSLQSSSLSSSNDSDTINHLQSYDSWRRTWLLPSCSCESGRTEDHDDDFFRYPQNIVVCWKLELEAIAIISSIISCINYSIISLFFSVNHSYLILFILFKSATWRAPTKLLRLFRSLVNKPDFISRIRYIKR